MSKLNKDIEFECVVGSNVVTVSGDKKYLSIIIEKEITYEEIKKYIVE